MLAKNLKIKLWEKYNFQHATIKHIKEWFAENKYLQDIDQRKNVEFLNDKSKLLVALAQATTDADFQRLLSTAVNASSSSKSPSSSIQEDEEQIDPEYDLDDLDSQPM
ncbi:hypothetical protein E6C27_scaffold213G00570 [Cucumis melo var. makuwa]|uniref:Uncharacterized protein n=1 Tax=Cucumis melo var. makuwa TaxID=1194695 RepID=A0A5A7SWC0_CUCMM|nr:hypothetical protein E6C27_scaffold213G00570 [Cucumis melo var. makuwa]